MPGPPRDTKSLQSKDLQANGYVAPKGNPEYLAGYRHETADHLSSLLQRYVRVTPTAVTTETKMKYTRLREELLWV